MVISDQGREFLNELNEQFFFFTKTEHRVTSAYHPQTNGLTDQMIQQALVKFVNDNQNDWDEKLYLHTEHLKKHLAM